MNEKYARITRDGLWNNNVVFAQMLALCPTLAVTSSATNGLAWDWQPRRCWWVSNMVISSVRTGQPRGAHPGVHRADRYAGDAADMALNAWVHELYKVLGLFHRADRGELCHPRPRRSVRLQK